MAHKTKKHVESEPDRNPDPITDAPGAHPVGVGIGAAVGGAAAGAAAGSVAGPVDTVAGAAIGAVAGGYAGKAAAESIDLYHSAGGRHVLYVGEGPGGRTGDDVFHARLGDVTTCVACAYGVATSPCVCGVEPHWERVATIALPNWPGSSDQLNVYARRVSAPSAR